MYIVELIFTYMYYKQCLRDLSHQLASVEFEPDLLLSRAAAEPLSSADQAANCNFWRWCC